MKLVYAIVNSDDTYAVNKGLLKAGIRATKLSSTGGFQETPPFLSAALTSR